MRSIDVGELCRHTTRIIHEVERTGKPIIVTCRGHPVAALSLIEGECLEDLVLASASEFIESLRAAEDDYREGHAEPAEEAYAELGIERD